MKNGTGGLIKSSPVELARENINLLILIVMIIIGSLVSKQFLTLQNWQNISRQIAVNGILSVGVTLVFLAGGFDLSIAGTLSLCGCLAVGLQSSMPIPLAVFISIFVGSLMGALNGILLKITRGDLSETFLITLGTQLVGSSLALTYTSGRSLFTTRGSSYDFFGRGTIMGFPFSAIILISLMIILQFVLSKTSYGRKIYLTGGNKAAAFLSGINVSAIKISVFTFAGFCAAVAGVVSSSRGGTAVYTMGNGTDFDACIAVLIGGNVLGGGKGGMFQTLIGVVIYGLISNILNLATVPPPVQTMLKGTLLLLAILLNGLKRK